MSRFQYAGQIPAPGDMKITKYTEYVALVDSFGQIEPCSYDTAVKTVTEAGFRKVSDGEEIGQPFELWRYDPDSKFN